MQNPFFLFNKKELCVALFFFAVSLERYKFLASGIKTVHIFYLLVVLLYPLSKINAIKFNLLEAITLMLYFFSLWFSLLVSTNISKSFLWSIHLSLILSVPFLLGNLFRPTLHEIIKGTCIGAVPAACIGIFQIIYYIIYPEAMGYNKFPRIYGSAYESGNYAHILFFGCIPLLLCFFNLYKKEGKGNKLILGFSILNTTMLILSTGRTGWLCFFTFIFLCATYQPSIKKIKTFLSFLTFLFVFPLVNSSFRELFLDYFNRNLSDDPRIEGMKIGWQIAMNNPFFGVGLGGFGAAVKKDAPIYWNTIRDTLIESKKATLEWELTPFNSLIEHIDNFGFFGLSWLILGYICLLRSCRNSDKIIYLFILLSGIAGTFPNQSLFRSYVVFIPLLYYGSMVRNRSIPA